MSIKVGINGLGRIGRSILRIALNHPDMEVVVINDINPDVNNIAYLLKYDSIYGRMSEEINVDGDSLFIDGNAIKVFCEKNIDQVEWYKEGVEYVIDSSGISKNIDLARNLQDSGVKSCIVTNSPEEDKVDCYMIPTVNHDDFDPKKHFIVSSSICDANAFVPVADILDRNFGIEHGFLTTLHPWLNYQNLLDGPSISYATPGEIYDYYSLGRSSVGSLIPKTTSAIDASCKVLKQLEGKFQSMSYRVPTMVVASGDLTVKLNKDFSVEDIKSVFEDAEKNQKWKVIHNNKEPLVSTDFIKYDYSAVVDHRWIMKNGDNYLKMVLWYDNEWAYSARVVDVVEIVAEKHNSYF